MLSSHPQRAISPHDEPFERRDHRPAAWNELLIFLQSALIRAAETRDVLRNDVVPVQDFRNLVTQFFRQIALELVSPCVLWPARLAGTSAVSSLIT